MALYLGDKLISSNLAGGDTNPIGSVIAFAGSNAPVGYLMCDGSAVSRETYADLFAVIGTTYGSGDGSTTFNLPDAQGRTLVGRNPSDTDANNINFSVLGSNKGSKYLQSHNHTDVSYSSINYIYSTDGYGGFARGNAAGFSSTMKNTGTGDSENIQPSLVLNYIIKATHNVTIQGVDTMSEAEYEDLIERLV